MEHKPKTQDQGSQIELRLKELIQLILPLHALLEGGYDETADRFEEVIDSLTQIALALKTTVKTLSEERGQLSPALDLRLKSITRNQDRQMQMLEDLHNWLGGPHCRTVAQGS